MPVFEASEVDGAQVVDLPRGPGRPGGQKKTGGRKKGSKNRRTVEVEMFLRPALPAAKRRVKELLASKDEEIALKTATLLLGYVFGRPRERRELSGPDGSPIEQRTEIIEASQRVVAAMAGVANEAAPAEALGDEGLRGVQAINFLQAQREAAERAGQPVAPTPAPVEDRTVEASSQPEESTRESEVQGAPEPPLEGHTLSFIEGNLCIVDCPPDRDGLPPIYEVRTTGGSLVKRGPFDIALELVKRHSGGGLGRWLVQEPRPQIGPSRPDQAASRASVRPQVLRRRP